MEISSGQGGMERMDEKGNMKTAPVDGIGQSLKNKAENINGLLAGFLPKEGVSRPR